MYIPILYLIIACFLGATVVKANKHRAEWLLLLLIMSYIKTCIVYLFNATTVFTVITLGGTANSNRKIFCGFNAFNRPNFDFIG